MTSSDTDSLDLTTPRTPGKGFDSSYRIPKIQPAETSMDTDSQPTPGQKVSEKSKKIHLSDRAKKMVWGELSKIKHVRTTASKVHFLCEDMKRAKADKTILPMFSIQKNLPQLPGGDLSWAFQSEWQNILTECSKQLMDATANYLLTEKMCDLDKTAKDMAQKATLDFKRALPSDEREDGLRLFDVVDNSMKKHRKRRKQNDRGKVTKPTAKTGKHRLDKRRKNNNDTASRRLKM